MMSVREVEGGRLVFLMKEKLKSVSQIKPPAWASFAKTGSHRERPPQQPDFWHTRAAAVLRRIYLDGPVGVSRLRTYFGGKRRRGYKPARSRRAAGNMLRKILQQLEAAGLVTKDKKGRRLTPAGQKFVNSVAKEIKKS